MKEFTVIFFATWKFAAIFPLAFYAMNMSFAEIMLYANIGGVLGVLIFSFFFKVLIDVLNRYWPEKLKIRNNTNKVFTKRSRMILKIKMKYGLMGIVILSPSVLSIPVGSFLVTKYYGLKTKNLIYLVMGQIAWSLIFCYFYMQVKSVL